MQQLTILHINKFHYFRDGASNVYLRTASILEAHNHRSVFFSMNNPDNLKDCKTSEYFMSYVDLNVQGRNIVSQLKIAGRFLYSFDAKKRLSMLLDKYPVDIAHLHNIYHHISPSILYVLKKRKIPVVMTLHDYKMVCASYSMIAGNKICEDCSGGKYFMAIKNRCVKESLAKSILSTIEMYLHHKILNIYDNVDIFISPSLFLKNKLEEMGFKKEIVHLPNFVDTFDDEDLSPDVKDGECEKEISITYFGRLSEEKGLLTLLEAAKLLSKNSSMKIEIKIIGDGPIREKLQQKVNAEEINNARFLGFLTGKVLIQEIKKSFVHVIPSEWYENSPISVVEAFAMSIPVIGSRIGGIPELIKDNETGLTFEPGNSADLAFKIEYLINNPDKVIELVENARAYVEQELSAEKYYERLMEIYKQVAS